MQRLAWASDGGSARATGKGCLCRGSIAVSSPARRTSLRQPDGLPCRSSLLQLGGCELARELAGGPTVRALSIAGRVAAVVITCRGD
jgi:hypothetical protein